MHSIEAIAIDGPAASGKTTVGRELASKVGYTFLDTGLMYRAITFWALETGIALQDKDSLRVLAENKAKEAGEIALHGGREVFHSDIVGKYVSAVSSEPFVRKPLVRQQRVIASRGPIVMVGRDVGTVILPDSFKIYLDASHTTRTKRRLAELLDKGRSENSDSIGEEIELRDELDSGRAVSPLSVAPDAIKILTDELRISQVVQLIIEALKDAK